ncbi:hypothetical protein TTHERM_00333240 (macronuclear) [Tetrahymena thermophila SB210]|uniref:Uncharacterized protein n=1 Tax=Tetrahymena thermophila (strain SB210) TaxID=312017 RepID=I7M1N6_TETTS|nr:hypothetical protein TTHERM_00333240 [Tetrahymena thermophila SB210]EAR97246.1 hypothetical protein TTHERM_00333240 [Tetrahymena thermophila SB210]|eukprot:XP_001017491.1 hypothetical protein TTHERM_00333240 [Tetrahymena thermophila SB210]
MGNSCASAKKPKSRSRPAKLYIHSKTQNIAYKGDANGISPCSIDLQQMSTEVGTALERGSGIDQNQIQIEAQIGNSTPISGQAYKNYIKIQINNIPVSNITPNNQSKFSKKSNMPFLEKDQQSIKKVTIPSYLTPQSNSKDQHTIDSSDVKQYMQQYFIDSWDYNVDFQGNLSKKIQKKENILKDFTKRERGLWKGPTQNSLFDAFYLAFTLNEDLVLNPHDIWDQILITLKQFYQKNNIKQSELFPNSKQIRKDSKIINYKETPNSKNKRELISWDSILKQIQEQNQQTLDSLSQPQSIQKDAAIQNNFKIKRISQLVYNQLIYLDAEFPSYEQLSYLPYTIFPGHYYQIRNIVFRSSLSDWFLLREKILSLIEVAPEFWIERLYFIIDNFVDTLQGKLNLQFWNQGFLTKSSEFPDFWRFGWMKELFNIEFDNNDLYQTGLIYTCQDVCHISFSSPFIFRIQEHKIDIQMRVQAHKSCLIQAKNLPNSFEPLLTMYLMKDKI